MSKVKILMVGPTETGKSTLANILADISEGPSGSYRPTKGCRIVEFEKDVPLAVKKTICWKNLRRALGLLRRPWIWKMLASHTKRNSRYHLCLQSEECKLRERYGILYQQLCKGFQSFTKAMNGIFPPFRCRWIDTVIKTVTLL